MTACLDTTESIAPSVRILVLRKDSLLQLSFVPTLFWAARGLLFAAHHRDHDGTTQRLNVMIIFVLKARDDLYGTDVYGVYASSPLANSSFSVPFGANSSTLLLLATGDFSRYVVVSFGNATARTTILGASLAYRFSSASTLSLALWFVFSDVHRLDILQSWTDRKSHRPTDCCEQCRFGCDLPFVNQISSIFVSYSFRGGQRDD